MLIRDSKLSLGLRVINDNRKKYLFSVVDGPLI